MPAAPVFIINHNRLTIWSILWWRAFSIILASNKRSCRVGAMINARAASNDMASGDFPPLANYKISHYNPTTHGGPPIHPNGAEIKHCLGPAMTAMFAVEPEPDNAGVGIELGLQNGIMDDSLPPSSLCRSLRRASLEISTDCGCVSNLCVASAASAASTLTVYTYDSFAADWGPAPAIEKAFEAQCGCDLQSSR